jgi:hypothetical protein
MVHNANLDNSSPCDVVRGELQKVGRCQGSCGHRSVVTIVSELLLEMRSLRPQAPLRGSAGPFRLFSVVTWRIVPGLTKACRCSHASQKSSTQLGAQMRFPNNELQRPGPHETYA